MRQHNGTILFTTFIILILGLYLISRIAFNTSEKYVPVVVRTDNVIEVNSPEVDSLDTNVNVSPPENIEQSSKVQMTAPNTVSNSTAPKERKPSRPKPSISADESESEEEIINREAKNINKTINNNKVSDL
jgi:hypothetical protein